MSHGYVPPRLTDEAEKCLREIGQADLVVGIPSFNNAGTIGHVTSAALAGLAKHFPSERAVLVNSDGGSTDGTRDTVLKTTWSDPRALLVEHPVSHAQKLVTPYDGLPGKGSAFRTIFHVARQLGARACAVVDSDLRSVTPDWFEFLLGPVLRDDVDFVTPLYLRHKFDGTITNSIVYPITRALYGARLRQPIGGDFGFSGRLAEHWLAQDVWESEVARFGIDIWMTTTAVTGGFSTAQAFLGAKIHDPKDPGADLSSMLVQVVGTVFRLMREHEREWKSDMEEKSVPLYGFPFAVGLEPVHVNRKRMVGLFQQGLRDLDAVYEGTLAPDTWSAVRTAARGDETTIDLDDDWWCRVVYDFAAAHAHGRWNRDTLLKALAPLYLGRVASFVRQHEHSDAAQVEEAIESLCRTFRSGRAYLLARWNGAPFATEVT
ncbi:MAG: glycosyltransferase [Candidatus Eiseniibacteriota bacterium]